jgi:hypothetical protein
VNKLLSSFILISTGLVGGYYGQPFLQEQLMSAGLLSTMDSMKRDNNSSNEPEVLYWVAPMDEFDKQGKARVINQY